jgi:putative transposase
MILQVLIAMVAGWVQRHQQQVIAYVIEENRVLTARLGGHRLRLTDAERRRLAALAHPLSRERLKAVATIATPDTPLRWYQRLITRKFDGRQHRRQLGRPRVPEEIEQLVYAWPKRIHRGAIAAFRVPW